MLSNDFQTLPELRQLAGKCPRCSLCKFPPLVTVEAQAHSGACPSYEEYKVHAASGAGLMVMAMSLVDGRSRVTETVRRLAYGCTACGACDVACKFNSDIEVLEAIYLLRARVLRDLGPLPAHARILDCIRRRGHPLPDAEGELGDWMRGVELPPAAEVSRSDRASTARRGGGASGAAGEPRVLLWIGPHYALEARHRQTVGQALALLRTAGVGFSVLGPSEPYTGRAAWEIGDRDLFAACAQRTAAAVRDAASDEVVCLSAEDYATMRALVPRIAPLAKPVRHIVELYAELVARGRLRPLRPVATRAAWHDASYLGRLSEPWVPWRGERKKVLGQMIVMEPRRPVRWGAGCYDPPRAVLRALPGLDLVELHRRRENAFDSGECGQAYATHPELVRHTAGRRLAEAASVGAEVVVTECPQSLAALGAAAGPAHPRVVALTGLLATSALKEAR